MQILANLIDGQSRAPRAGRYLDSIDPAIGQPFAQCPDSDAADVAEAVTAASRAAPGWAQTPAEARGRIRHTLRSHFHHQDGSRGFLPRCRIDGSGQGGSESPRRTELGGAEQ